MQITGNGTYIVRNAIQGAAGDKTILYVSGDFGTATVILGYYNGAVPKVFIPLVGGTLAVDDQYTITDSSAVPIQIKVTGANGATDIDIIAAGIS